MKKIVMLIGLVLLAVSGVFAQVSVAGQTFYYKYVESVNPDTGMKYIDKNLGDVMFNKLTNYFYLTFTQNSCYVSDEKGIVIPAKGSWSDSGIYGTWNHDGPYKYQKEENNLLVFMCTVSSRTTGFGSTINGKDQHYLYFSKDYKRINARSYDSDEGKWSLRIMIFERADPPQKVDPSKGPEAPKQLW